MIIFLDENDVEYGALATIKATNAVNGERSITGEIISGDAVLSRIERGWRLRFEDEYYVVTFAKPIDEGKNVQVSFDAVHQFFWDFGKSSVYDQLSDGSHTFRAYLDFIFNDSGYKYDIETSLMVKAFEKQSFGYKNRLSLFNDIITSSGVEFQVNGKVVRILAKVGTDLSTVVRKNFNLNELGIEKNIGNFVTYQKGFGAYFDEEDHSKGRLIAEYTSPLASIYGKLEADPLVDERYKQSESLLSALKETVDNSYTISVSLDMEDLTRAGYRYTQPVAGDYIMAINETLGFKEKIRIVSFTSEYDVAGQLIKHTVTCNDIGSVKKLSASYTQTQHQAANAEVNANTAYEFANKALVSANGKNTNYYGDTFPVDNPKGTLKKGDLLFLTVGDTVKQYYWNGAEWVTNPVVSDVEAFKEQIAEELKDVPNREEFENKISEEIANSKAEIGTQIETAKTQAESNAKEYADTINQETAKVAEQAKTSADEIKADLVNVKNNLTSTSIVANNAQASVDEAKQDLTEVASDLNTAKQDLANSVTAVNTKVDSTKAELTQAKQDLTSHAQQLQTQANAQTELTKRVTTVETTTNGTKTTVNELTKTVAQNGKDITSVTNRTKTVEDDLANTKTTLTQVQTTANSASQKTATLETGLNGLTAKFENLQIGTVNLLHNSKGPFKPNANKVDNWQRFEDTYVYLENGKQYVLSGETDGNFTSVHDYSKESDNVVLWLVNPDTNFNKIISDGKTGTTGTVFIWNSASGTYQLRVNTYRTVSTKSAWNIQIEEGNLRSTYSQNESDIESKVAEYKQTADQNYASLQSTVQNLDGTVQANKTTAEQTAAGFKTRIESLETYKNGESERANAYFESAKTETAKQLTAERTAIANNYVAKSTYTSDVTGIRNELSATTSTANATKTNLANYQASNDKAVANLQSNLQTANGNISNLQTKVEAVPGQITSAVSAVEGKIPTSVGSTNLLLYSADPSKAPTGYYDFTSAQKTSETYNGSVVYRVQSSWRGLKVNLGNLVDRGLLKVGDVLTYSVAMRAEQKTPIQARLFVRYTNESDAGSPTGKIEIVNLTADWQYVSLTFTVTAKMLAANTKVTYLGWELTSNAETDKYVYYACNKVERGNIATDWSSAPEDAIKEISSLSSQIKQTADGMTLLATKTELNTAKSDLQSGISTATNQANTAQSTADGAVTKANAAQSTADNNAKTISTHTTQISALNTGLSAKVSQTDFNTLSGRVTTAENNITAKANELSSKITSVEGKIPASVSQRNLIQGTSDKWTSFVDITTKNNWTYDLATIRYGDNTGIYPNTTINIFVYLSADNIVLDSSVSPRFLIQGAIIDKNGDETWTDREKYHPFYNKWSTNLAAGNNYRVVKLSSKVTSESYANINGFKIGVRIDGVQSGKFHYRALMVTTGDVFPDYWQPAPEDYDSKLATAQSEIKQTTDSIKASVQSLDNSTVKSSSLTINTDGVVIKAGKSTSDFANAVGSYFSVNQNAINLFSDKINVKGNMIVSGAITSDKIASKQINTAHLNGKIITADVISSNAVTADAIKAGAVTTDKMSANSINGDRITAGTLDAAKIKAGSITASQIASGTITSAQIKTGTISAANIAAGAITSDKIASNSIDASKIVANSITADMITGGRLRSTNGATVFDLNAGTLTFNNNYGYIQRVAGDKIFEITTFLNNNSGGSPDYLTSAFNVRKSDNSRLAGIKFTLNNSIENKPTAEAKMNADEFYLYDSTGTKLLSVHGRNTYLGNFNLQGWGDIPVADLYNCGLLVKDIGIGGRTKSLFKIVEELCNKTGVWWM